MQLLKDHEPRRMSRRHRRLKTRECKLEQSANCGIAQIWAQIVLDFIAKRLPGRFGISLNLISLFNPPVAVFVELSKQFLSNRTGCFSIERGSFQSRQLPFNLRSSELESSYQWLESFPLIGSLKIFTRGLFIGRYSFAAIHLEQRLVATKRLPFAPTLRWFNCNRLVTFSRCTDLLNLMSWTYKFSHL